MLSARLPILQTLFSVGGVWPKLPSRFRNAIKGVACVQTSVPLRNAIKISCLQQIVVYTYVSLSFSAVAVLTVSLYVATSKWQKLMRVRKTAKRLLRLMARTNSVLA